MQDFIERIREFIEENTMLTVCVCAILVLMVVFAVIVSPFAPSGVRQKESLVQEETFVPDQGILLPPEQGWEDEYHISREAKDRWDEAEALQWYHEPTVQDADSLGRENDALVERIIGAAP